MNAHPLRPDGTYHLPERMRPEFAKPWGRIVTREQLGALLWPDDVVIAVGDMVSLDVKELGVQPKLFICDYKTHRQENADFKEALGNWGDREIIVQNPAAQLTAAGWDAVAKALTLDGTTRIVVDGEEDMLGVPAFMMAPEGAVVLYGMPGQGIVYCRVDVPLQEKVAELVAALDLS